MNVLSISKNSVLCLAVVLLTACNAEKSDDSKTGVVLSAEIRDLGIFYQVISYTINYGYLCVESRVSDNALRRFAEIQATYLIESDRPSASLGESLAIGQLAFEKRNAALLSLARTEGIEGVSFDSTLMSVLNHEPKFRDKSFEVVNAWWSKVATDRVARGEPKWTVPPEAILELLDLALSMRSSFPAEVGETLERVQNVCARDPNRVRVLADQFTKTLIEGDFR